MPRRKGASGKTGMSTIGKTKGAATRQRRKRDSGESAAATAATIQKNKKKKKKIKKQTRAASRSSVSAPVDEPERTCRRCHLMFRPSQNHAGACCFHPEIFTGETKQRWMESGESLERARRDGSLGEIHYYWTCCGQEQRTSLGCARTRHSTYDDPPDSLTYS